MSVLRVNESKIFGCVNIFVMMRSCCNLFKATKKGNYKLDDEH